MPSWVFIKGTESESGSDESRSDNLAQTIVTLVQIAHDPFWSLVLGHKLTNFYIGRKSTTYYLLKVIIYPKSQRSILQNPSTTTCRKNTPSEVWDLWIQGALCLSVCLIFPSLSSVCCIQYTLLSWLYCSLWRRDVLLLSRSISISTFCFISNNPSSC